MGLVLTAEQRALFLALTYWRDIVGRMMSRQHPYVQKEKEALVELVRRVAAVKKEKMAEYAMTVEGLCREFTVRVG